MNNSSIDNDVSPNLCQEVEKDLFNPKTKATNHQRKVARRRASKKVLARQAPRNHDEKYIEKLGTLTMRQLIRRLKQAAREASHFKHVIARSDRLVAGKYLPLHDYALMCFTRVQTEIEFRTAPRETTTAQ